MANAIERMLYANVFFGIRSRNSSAEKKTKIENYCRINEVAMKEQQSRFYCELYCVFEWFSISHVDVYGTFAEQRKLLKIFENVFFFLQF